MKQNAMMTVGGFLLCGIAQVASAHISLERGGTHQSRHGDGQDDLKDGPCGRAGAAGQRGTNIYTYRPGETITVTFSEYVPHPGYFRFAFDNDGDDAFVDPVSILPIDPTRGCPYTPSAAGTDRCDASDFYNNDAVLLGMDNLDPHISTPFSPAKLWTYQVTLPNVECNNCTLQVIQVMEDPLGHGPFDGNLDVYHQCIDLVLTNAGGTGGAGGSTAGTGGGASGAGGEGGVGMAGAAGDGIGGTGAGGTSAGGTGAGTGGAGAGGTGFGGLGGGTMKDDSGCSVTDGRTNTSVFAPLLLGVSLMLMRRRRRA